MLAPREVPAELIHLVSILEDGVSNAGFSVEQQTLCAAYYADEKRVLCRHLPELSAPIAWQAREWLLVKSEQTSGGSVYAPVGRWSLE